MLDTILISAYKFMDQFEGLLNLCPLLGILKFLIFKLLYDKLATNLLYLSVQKRAPCENLKKAHQRPDLKAISKASENSMILFYSDRILIISLMIIFLM